MPRAKRTPVTKSETPAKTIAYISTEKTNGKTGNANGNSDLETTIRARAYELYEKRGRHDGYAQDDWLQAEAELLSQVQRTA